MASRSDGITRLYEVPQVPESERLPQPPKTKDKVLLDERGLLDLPFLALTVLLVLIGVVMVFSASYARAFRPAQRQPTPEVRWSKPLDAGFQAFVCRLSPVDAVRCDCSKGYCICHRQSENLRACFL